MERKQAGQRILAFLLLALGAVCVAVPFVTLFTGGGTYSWQFKSPETAKMIGEIALVFALTAGGILLIRRPLFQWGFTALICLLFNWIHVVFLPMAVSALYLGYLLLTGYFLRVVLFRQRKLQSGWMADFILGTSAVLSAFCLLSAFHAGSVGQLRWFSLLSGAALLIWLGVRTAGERRQPGLKAGTCGRKCPESTQSGEEGRRRTAGSLLIAFLIVMILIQAGRMNLALDFDTLWYGVRSEYVLDNGSGIYENPGMVGMAYVYAKGLETLMLPLCDLASHSYLLYFNLWLAAAGLFALYRLSCLYMDRRFALLSAALVSCVPGIMNMSITAKPDIITWVIQIIMVFYMCLYIKDAGETGERRFPLLALSAGAYLLSLTMKSTSLVFSTAVFGMSGLYLIFRKLLRFRAPIRQWLLLLFPAGALTGIWARTMLITGMPVTSVFTSVFEKLGFQMKYPFASSSLPQNWEEAGNAAVLARRLFHMLLMPTGDDMGHVVFAWGSPLLLFLTGACLAACLLLAADTGRRGTRKRGMMQSLPAGREKRKEGGRSAPGRERGQRLLSAFAHTVFWPFLAVNLVSLVMLYQIDGNYFMLLYTGIIIGAVSLLSSLARKGFRRFSGAVCLLLIPIMTFNVLLTAESNWAWSLGFSEIQWVNKGRVNHEALQHEKMVQTGNEQIWNILSQDSATRVIAFGDHPGCLQFPCIVQSYKDITSPWGNVELVNTVEAFEEYMAYAKADYAYVEAGFIGEGSWEWSYGLVRQMISRGTLTDLKFEHGNVLARVDLNGRPDSQSRENLRLFDENYLTYEMKQAGEAR